MAGSQPRAKAMMPLVTVIGLLLVVLALWAFVFVEHGRNSTVDSAAASTPSQQSPSAGSAGTTASSTTSSSETTGSSPTQSDGWSIDDAREALATDGSHVLVLGDGTGDGFDEWAFLWAESQGLPAAMWMSETAAGYSGVTEETRLWSGSTTDATANYPLEHWDAMWPETTPDLVLLSFGHFAPSPDEATQSLEELRATIADAAPDTPIVVILQNPKADDANADVRQAIADWADQAGLPTIDVAAAFADSDQIPANLRLDQMHPSTAGSELWAQTVGDALA